VLEWRKGDFMAKKQSLYFTDEEIILIAMGLAEELHYTDNQIENLEELNCLQSETITKIKNFKNKKIWIARTDEKIAKEFKKRGLIIPIDWET
jgi:hypothetical protein